MKVPHCNDCEHHIKQTNGRTGNYHKCSLKAQQPKPQGFYHDGLMYASEARTSPFWCPRRKENNLTPGQKDIIRDGLERAQREPWEMSMGG